MWSETQGKVVEFSQGEDSRPSSRSSSPVKARRFASALSRSESLNNVANEEEDEKDKRIRELEETLKKQKELMEILQKKLSEADDAAMQVL